MFYTGIIQMPTHQMVCSICGTRKAPYNTTVGLISTTKCSNCNNTYYPVPEDKFVSVLDGTPSLPKAVPVTTTTTTPTIPVTNTGISLDAWLVAFVAIALLGWWLKKQPQYRDLGTGLLFGGSTAFVYRLIAQNQKTNA